MKFDVPSHAFLVEVKPTIPLIGLEATIEVTIVVTGIAGALLATLKALIR